MINRMSAPKSTEDSLHVSLYFLVEILDFLVAMIVIGEMGVDRGGAKRESGGTRTPRSLYKANPSRGPGSWRWQQPQHPLPLSKATTARQIKGPSGSV